MSNGFSAADMSTAAANGHAEGYQVGHADAVKAYEAGKPAAAQEAVAWVPPSFFDNGVVAATARRKPPSETAVAMRGEYVPLYAAPVAAAPVVVAVRVEGIGTAHLHLVDGGVDIPAMTIQHMAKHLADASTPAAPGIDHLRSVINTLSRSISDAYEAACLNGDERMQTVQNARQSLLNTIREAMPLIDASPKGGSDDAPKYTTGHCENHKKPGGCPMHNLQCGYPQCDRRQATSAEVGA